MAEFIQNPRVRIAPSPTGFLHIGTARTALFNYLIAKKYNGTFILRIEDTDLRRSATKYEKSIIEGLKWLGLEWDEGVKVGGEYGPYRQSEKIAIYSKYINQLYDEGKIYPCFCSKKELDAQRLKQIKKKNIPAYSGKCRNLSKAEVEKKMKAGKKFIFRFKTPSVTERPTVEFEDLIKGKISVKTDLIGDFSISKNFNMPLYNLAVVIDDYKMKINYVIRGEDHISNTPKQILLYEALGFAIPKFGHLPLILAPDKSKMSKRFGATSIDEFRKMGYLPEALVNFMALLGWHSKTDREIFTLKELIEEFSIEQIQQSGAIFNIEKLNWLNGYYIRQKSIDDLFNLLYPNFLPSKIKLDNDYIKKVIALERERIKKLEDFKKITDYFFRDNIRYSKKLICWKDQKVKEAKEILEDLLNTIEEADKSLWSKEWLRNVLMKKSEEIGDRGQVYWPFRVALTGKDKSPDPLDIAETLGRDKVISRLKNAIKKLATKR